MTLNNETPAHFDLTTIDTDKGGNIRIYRLPSGRGADHEIDISLASDSSNIIFKSFIYGMYEDCSFSPDLLANIVTTCNSCF
jgi:hypothetical protein